MLRPVTDSDFETVHGIYMDDTVNTYMCHDPMDKDAFKGVFSHLRNRDHFFIFEHDDEACGLCTLILDKGRTRHCAYLGTLGVKSERQGQGLGKQLIGEIEDFLRTKDIRLLYFMVEADNERGIAFYKALGFENSGRLPGFFKRENDNHYVDELIFSKTLNSSN